MLNSRRLDTLLVFIFTLAVLIFLGLEYRQTTRTLLRIQIDFERRMSDNKGRNEASNEVLLSQSRWVNKIDGYKGKSSVVHVRLDGANEPIQIKTTESAPSMAQNNKQREREKPLQANNKTRGITVAQYSKEEKSQKPLTKEIKNATTSTTEREEIIRALKNLPQCREKPDLLGNITVDTNPDLPKPTEMKQVQFGGWWSPNHCKARVKVAILVPLRNRRRQLQVFLRHITPVLQRQLLQYRIFVVEQVGKTAFNKGAIYNIGFNETLRYDDYDCYIFHDVDLLTENDYNYYGCPSSPLHMSVAIDSFNYRLPYPNIFGGIQALKREHYVTMNGYSNKYWGWGAEDDDLFKRAKDAKLPVQRPQASIARYKMNKEYHFAKKIDHSLWRARNMGLLSYLPLNRKFEGLNSVSALKYAKNIFEYEFYTHILIDLAFDEGG